MRGLRLLGDGNPRSICIAAGRIIFLHTASEEDKETALLLRN